VEKVVQDKEWEEQEESKKDNVIEYTLYKDMKI
jgi:hypothetical protein